MEGKFSNRSEERIEVDGGRSNLSEELEEDEDEEEEVEVGEEREEAESGDRTLGKVGYCWALSTPNSGLATASFWSPFWNTWGKVHACHLNE